MKVRRGEFIVVSEKESRRGVNNLGVVSFS